MRLDAMRSFVTLVETGSYVAASEALFTSATTLHGHVRSLEEELGVELVTFAGRRLDLTRAGSRFLVFAQRSLADFEEMHGDLRGMARKPNAQLRVVSLHGPSVHLLPPVVRAFQDLRPEVTVSVSPKGVGESLAALVSGQADLAVLNDLHDDLAIGTLASSILCEDRLVLVIRSDHYREPARDLLRHYPIAVQSPASRYRHYVERWARQEGIDLRMVYEHGSFDGILTYVLEGGCVGMMGAYVAKREMERGEVCILNLPTFSMQRNVIALHAARPDPVVTEFVRTFQRISRYSPVAIG